MYLAAVVGGLALLAYGLVPTAPGAIVASLVMGASPALACLSYA
jgi:hypothetical protein